MWQQRIHSIWLPRGVKRKNRKRSSSRRTFDLPKNRSWRPFQLAFILLNLPGLTELDHPDRGAEPRAPSPTCSGSRPAAARPRRTSGLTAYTLAIRRLQGDGRRARRARTGVAVLMRYTLRLLTLQQFQRATALICACEVIRREADARGRPLGQRRRSASASGSASATTPEHDRADAAEAIKQDHGQPRSAAAAAARPHQLTNCPWCGTRDRARQAHRRRAVRPRAAGRTLIYCGDKFGAVPVQPRKQSPGEGLPVARGRRGDLPAAARRC